MTKQLPNLPKVMSILNFKYFKIKCIFWDDLHCKFTEYRRLCTQNDFCVMKEINNICMFISNKNKLIMSLIQY